jgi:hypothetical protein
MIPCIYIGSTRSISRGLVRKCQSGSAARYQLLTIHDRTFLEASDAEDYEFAIAKASRRALEIRRTWSFLFQPRRSAANRLARAAYRKLPVPAHLKEFLRAKHPRLANASIDILEDVIEQDLQKSVYDMTLHMSENFRNYNTKLNGRYGYNLFPNYRKQMEILTRYMADKKPRSLGQLWRDNRDQSSYYTFWAVIIFGSTSLVLAALSLVASIIQAWASIYALHH